ncbi:MAG TPA: hypothetical protein VFL47_01835 [Flavisolibacter sp.]|nr:hypothetical protein [Flavisolibacter sp.]
MGSLFVAVLLLALLVSLFYGKKDNIETAEKEKEVIARLRARYQEALRAGDKEKAVQYGHDYYRYLRNSRQLRAFDEQAIENDVAEM